MRTLLTTFSVLALTSLAHPGISHALVREMALCNTADGNYQVTVQDNQGIGFHRDSHVTATVATQNGTVVASYQAALYHGINSVSEGRPHFVDTGSRGSSFVLAGPSTNEKNYILRARINGGEISDENVDCQIFDTN